MPLVKAIAQHVKNSIHQEWKDQRELYDEYPWFMEGELKLKNLMKSCKLAGQQKKKRFQEYLRFCNDFLRPGSAGLDPNSFFRSLLQLQGNMVTFCGSSNLMGRAFWCRRRRAGWLERRWSLSRRHQKLVGPNRIFAKKMLLTCDLVEHEVIEQLALHARLARKAFELAQDWFVER